MHVATLGLGANLGDRLRSLQSAVDLLAAEGVRAVASSRVWETDPVGGPPDQPPYLNAVILTETQAGPHEVLAACNRVEAELGRTREIRWGSRTIDIDVLLYDELIVNEPELTIPHPRMTERSFVVLPLLELDPDPILADGTRILDLAVDGDGARPYAPPLVLP
jgi:2-amino-4-hydroxy-6-hydroxymethyldihydropteridine diphosphokinase